MRAKDAIWATLANLSQQVFSFITMLVVARLLEPALFGVIATAMLLVLALQRVLLESIGFAIIQKPELDNRFLDTAFIVSLIAGTLMAAALFFSADWLAAGFNEPRLAAPLKALSALVWFDALAMLPLGILRRNFKFKALAIRTFAANVLSGVVGIGMAYAGMGVWSLVAQQVVASLGSLAGLWLYADWRPRWQWSAPDYRELQRFGAPMIGNAVFLVLVNRLDILLLSAAAGATATGLYSLAKRIVRTITDLIVSGVVNVSLSSLSALQNDDEKRNRFLQEKIRLTALIAFPLFAGLAAFAPFLVPEMLGARWVPAVPLIQILCVFGMLQLPVLYGANALVAAGKSRVLFVFNAAGTVLLFALMQYGLKWGAVGVASAFLLQSLISYLALVLVLKMQLNVNGAVLIVSIIRPALCAAGMYLIAYCCLAYMGLGYFVVFSVAFFLAALAYLIFAALLMRNDLFVFLGFIRARLRR